jgi:RHS repeat-associated protein
VFIELTFRKSVLNLHKVKVYGFQGQEADDEIKGEGNSYNYEYRMHDPRLGRFFAIDPLAPEYPWYTPYQFSGNRPIDCVELEGLEPSPATVGQDGCVEARSWTEVNQGKIVSEGFRAVYQNGVVKEWTKDRVEKVWVLQKELGSLALKSSTPSIAPSTPEQTAEGTFLQNMNAIGFNGSFRDRNADVTKALASYLDEKGYGGLSLATSISGGISSAFIKFDENQKYWFY